MLAKLQRYARSLRNLIRDVRFGGRFLGGGVPTRFAHLHANDVANSDYHAMAEMFGRVALSEHSVVVDVGCGKGRVINFLLSRGAKCEIIGVEIDPDIARATAQRLRRYPNVRIETGNIIDLWPERATVFYVYNPFGAPVVEQFCDRLAAHSRPFVVLYYNCLHRQIFERRGFRVEYHPRDRLPAFQRRLGDTDMIHDFCLVEPPGEP
jgi:protein-L-isoaspartate O-methyltransferase